jgi:Uncharacterized conserved protein
MSTTLNTPRPCLALLTDFGLADPYVGQLKAAIYRQCPDALIVDISHQVPAFNVRVAGYFLAASAPHFAPGTVFLTVVDPGVGSERDIVALETGSQIFIAPNNAILSLIGQGAPGPANSLWRLLQVEQHSDSSTFAGRDLLAPAVGKLLTNRNLEEIAGPIPLNRLHKEHWSHAKALKGKINAEILHVDHFGNVVINLSCKQKELVEIPASMLCKFRGKEYPLFSAAHYAQIPGRSLGLVPGSQGYMEISMNRGSAAFLLGVELEADMGMPADLQLSISY